MKIIQSLYEKQQRRGGYLTDSDMREVAATCNCSLHRIEELVSFFPHFRKTPPPKVSVHICRDMSCHLRKSTACIASLQEWAASEYGAQVEVAGVSCLGRCDRAVAAQVNESLYVERGESELKEIVASHANGAPAEPDTDRSIAEPKLGSWDIDIYQGNCDYAQVRSYLTGGSDPFSVLSRQSSGDQRTGPLERAGLLGMGGAGGRAFKKWGEVYEAEGARKYVVCNADESEPGTFKDRDLLLLTPYLTIEGMIIAGLVVGATQGWIYVRHEYPEQVASLRQEIERARQLGALGSNIFHSGKSFELDVFVSPGNYICGEQTALIEAMEDKRAEPRIRPPELQTNGLWNCPTLLNNVETFAWVPRILSDDGEWYSQQARTRSKWLPEEFGKRMHGRRFFSISGDVQRPGAYEVPTGITLGELIDEYCGGMRNGVSLQAVATSGPSGGILPAELSLEQVQSLFRASITIPPGEHCFRLRDLPLDIHFSRQSGIMIGAGIVVYGSECDVVTEALANSRFFRNESCGKCVPCRIGSQKITEMGERLAEGAYAPEALPVLEEEIGQLAQVMSEASICGLGQVASSPMKSLFKFFRDDVQECTRNPKS